MPFSNGMGIDSSPISTYVSTWSLVESNQGAECNSQVLVDNDPRALCDSHFSGFVEQQPRQPKKKEGSPVTKSENLSKHPLPQSTGRPSGASSSGNQSVAESLRAHLKNRVLDMANILIGQLYYIIVYIVLLYHQE